MKTGDKAWYSKRRPVFFVEMFLAHIVDVSNDSHFSLVMKWFLEEGIVTDKELADHLKVSLPTIRRWSIGINLPGVSVRPSIYKFLSVLFKEKLMNS